MTAEDKLRKLKAYLSQMDGLVIAFSGGVDSTFLLKVASDVLGESVVAVTARSSTYPEREYLEAVDYAKAFNVKHIVIESEELDVEGFADNPPNRCYLCKHELYTKIRNVADSLRINSIADGSNLDDLGDYRPGMLATKELGVISPLKDIGLTKSDIRALSEKMEIPTWNKPAFACLSSRFPYGQKITREALNRVDLAEQYLLDFGFKQVRVRDYGDLARIEVGSEERTLFFSVDVMNQIHRSLVAIGYCYVTLDLLGYRTGSMNEALSISTSY